jgi:hypothetical protein
VLVDVLVPVLHRPHRAAPFVHSLYATVGRDACRVTIIAGLDDLQTAEAWARTGVNVVVCPAEPGSFAQRINYGYKRTYRPWMLLCGDDLSFYDGWLEALERANERVPRARVIGTNDLGNGSVTAGLHATHMLISRDYVNEVGASWDGPGIVCHEGYRHCYVDNEIVEAAKQRQVWEMAIDSIIEHLHPAWGKADMDETYALGIGTMGADALVYQARYAAHQ